MGNYATFLNRLLFLQLFVFISFYIKQPKGCIIFQFYLDKGFYTPYCISNSIKGISHFQSRKLRETQRVPSISILKFCLLNLWSMHNISGGIEMVIGAPVETLHSLIFTHSTPFCKSGSLS